MDSSKELAASEKERKPAGEESEEPSSEFPSTSSGMSTRSGEKRRRLETEISRLKKEMRFMKRPLMLDVPALLLTTLEELTEEQLKTFQSHLTSGQLFGFPPIPERQLDNTDRQDTVDHMVKRYGPERAVEITLWILREMKLNDLADKLERDHTRGIPTASYKSSFQLRPKSSFDVAILSNSFLSLDSSQTLSLTSAGSSGQLSSQRPSTTHPVPALLLPTLEELTEEQLKTFQSHLTSGQLFGFPPIPERQLENTDRQDTVDHMVKRYGPERAVEITLWILREMKLNDLADKLERDHTRGIPTASYKSSFQLRPKSSFDVALLSSSFLSLDSSQTLSLTSAGSSGQLSSQRPSTTHPVPALLLPTLEELTEEQLKTFQSHLTSGQLFGFPPIPERQLENTDRQDTVDHMVKRYGPERAVEITLWILREMKLNDLADKLERDHTRGIPTASYKSSFQLRPKSSFDVALLSSSFLSLDSSQTLSLTSAGSSGQLSSQRPFMLDVPALLLTTLEELTEEQLKTFQSHLTSGQLFGFPPIPESHLENSDRQDTVDHMVKRYGPERAVGITLWILREMKLNDLAVKLQRDHTRGIPTASYKSSFQLRPKSSFDDALLSSSFLSLDSSQKLSLTSAGSSGQLSSQEVAASGKERKPAGEESEETYSELPSTSSVMSTRSGEKRRRLETEISRLKKEMRFMKVTLEVMSERSNVIMNKPHFCFIDFI
ncbi:uncharacterized protein LOC129839520 [Salvelinus fontinalis]|uniref:uncharacterized protein LOC129839520 n=1 Tax=Salvelinus fontinalis TaxID=8038 RepID=UPI002484DF4C|nr:uncharacterized protein LOC129839520 [Salvelinus fontinalis]